MSDDSERFAGLKSEIDALQSQQEQNLMNYGIQVSELLAQKRAIQADIESLKAEMSQLTASKEDALKAASDAMASAKETIDNAERKSSGIIDIANYRANQIIVDAEKVRAEALKIKDETAEAYKQANIRFKEVQELDVEAKKNYAVSEKIKAEEVERKNALDKRAQKVARDEKSVEGREQAVMIAAAELVVKEKHIEEQRVCIKEKMDAIEVMRNELKEKSEKVSQIKADLESEKSLFESEKIKKIEELKRQKENNNIERMGIAERADKQRKDIEDFKRERAAWRLTAENKEKL